MSQLAKAKAKKEKRLHASLVSNKRLKRSIDSALRPSSNPPVFFTDPLTGCSASDQTRNCQIVSDSLASLGGDPDFSPNDEALEPFLANLPSCPSATRVQPLSDVPWEWFMAKLKSAAHGKAGGEDGLNFSVLSICPEPIRKWLWLATNLHLRHLMPPAWQRANAFLLFKKGDPRAPKKLPPHQPSGSPLQAGSFFFI